MRSRKGVSESYFGYSNERISAIRTATLYAQEHVRYETLIVG